MWIFDIFKLLKEWRNERRTFDVSLLSASHQDLSDNDMVISPNSIRFLFEIEIVNGFNPNLGLKRADLRVGGQKYCISPNQAPLQQGEVRKIQLSFPTPKGVSAKGPYILALEDTRGRIVKVNGVF